ncbi:MAG: DUF6754 domain-containing protein [Candidatus Promineifilaceae bacterium]
MNLVALLIAIVVAAVLILLTRRIQSGREVGLRPVKGYQALTNQVGRAVESGRRVHVSLGRAALNTSTSPTSLAALAALDHLAQDGSAADVPPIVTVGEGTLLPAAQDQLRGAYTQVGRSKDYNNTMVEFVAPDSSPMSYAAGVSDVVQHNNVGSNLLLGHFGPEVGIILEAAGRQNMDQIVGSDDPMALAVGAAMSDELLIGEELFAAGAYLKGSPSQIASLQVQDILRLLVVAAILLFAVINLLLGA